MMGSDEQSDERPVHKVKLSNFYLARTEVTNAQYAAFLNEYGSDKVTTGEYVGQTMVYEHKWGIQSVGTGRDLSYKPANGYENHPIVYVTWYGAYEYCRFYGYTLPTEAQWEYAARGGTVGTGRDLSGYKYAGSNNIDSVAWYRDNSYSKGSDHPDYGTHAVAQKLPNPLGIFDMSGNVYEWCND